MRTLAALLLFCALHSGFACFADTRQPSSECEKQALSGNPAHKTQISAMKAYIDAARKGMKVQAISFADLEWAAGQTEPVSPFRNSREIGNLSVRDVLSQAARKIRKEDWPNVALEIRKLIAELSKVGEAVQAARAMTASIWKWKALPHFVHPTKGSGSLESMKFHATVDKKTGWTVIH